MIMLCIKRTHVHDNDNHIMTTMTDTALIDRLRNFIEDEARSCSMDFGCITPLYIYRMWGGVVALRDIERAMSEMKKMM